MTIFNLPHNPKTTLKDRDGFIWEWDKTNDRYVMYEDDGITPIYEAWTDLLELHGPLRIVDTMLWSKLDYCRLAYVTGLDDGDHYDGYVHNNENDDYVVDVDTGTVVIARYERDNELYSVEPLTLIPTRLWEQITDENTSSSVRDAINWIEEHP